MEATAFVPGLYRCLGWARRACFDRESRVKMRLFRPITAISDGRLNRLSCGRRCALIAADVLLALMLACALTAAAAVAASAAIPQRHESTPNPTATGDMGGMSGDMGGMSDMPGMDHGSGSSETPGMSSDMPGMEHGPGSDVPGMGHGTDTGGPAPDRPLGLVLGGFGAASAAVMASAGFVRRRDLAAGKTRRGRSNARTVRP
jgi:hypothetical protein